MIERPYLKIKLLNDRAFLPFKRDEDASYDLYAIYDDNEFIVLNPGDIKMMKTGIAIEIPPDWLFYIAERSSTGTKGLATRCGIIDSGYRGEIFIPINNTSNKPIVFTNHKDDEKLGIFLRQNKFKEEDITIYPRTKAIAQGMLIYSPHVCIEKVDELSSSERGAGALGSTGK